MSEIIRLGKSERFVADRKEYWEKLKNILSKINKSGYRSLIDEEIKEFPNLYRKICTDSELSKTQDLSPDVQEYINNLLQFSHNVLHTSPKVRNSFILDFFVKDFPTAIMKNWKTFVFVTLLFFGICGLSFYVISTHPEYAAYVVPKEMLDMMKDSYSKDISDQRDLNANIQMAGYYINNNVTIAFQSILYGVTYGLGTLFTLVYNGIMIGSIAGFVVSEGHGANFFNFVIAHSSLELLGICLAASAGLSIGLSMIIPTAEKRSRSFKNKVLEISPIILTSALFITIAAFIEGFISPSKINIIIKISIAAVTAILIFAYSYRMFFIRVYRNFKIGTRHNR
jgi:uncharacterized membrane protein SpoIIM required for sporulation